MATTLQEIVHKLRREGKVDRRREEIEMTLVTLLRRQQDNSPTTARAVADTLDRSSRDIATLLTNLASQGLIRSSSNGAWVLTDTGREWATRVLRRHRLAERLLTDVLNLSWAEAHDEACKLEHVLSMEEEDRLAKALGDPATCPHGNPVPTADGTISRPAGEPLNRFRPGERGRIVRIAPEKRELLTRLSSFDLLPDTDIEVESVAPLGGPILVRVGPARYAIGQEIAAQIRVERVSSITEDNQPR